MNNQNLDKSDQTWSTIDIDLVCRVSWCSFDFFQQKIRERLTDDKNGLVFNLLKRSFPDELECMCGAAVVCGDMQAEKHFFETYKNGIQFLSIDGLDISMSSMDKYTPPE